MGEPKYVAILIFDDVETLDFAGPFEVFSVAGRAEGREPFVVYTVAQTLSLVQARRQLTIKPRFSIEESPPPAVLVVPGGLGARRELDNPVIIDWIRETAARAEVVMSVCTGSLLLGRAGLLDGLEATTHHRVLDLLGRVAPAARIVTGRRYTDNGRILTSCGISGGLDLSLHVVARLLGREEAEKTAAYMEYDWRAEPS